MILERCLASSVVRLSWTMEDKCQVEPVGTVYLTVNC
jgi:hypothetical protein